MANNNATPPPPNPKKKKKNSALVSIQFCNCTSGGGNIRDLINRISLVARTRCKPNISLPSAAGHYAEGHKRLLESGMAPTPECPPRPEIISISAYGEPICAFAIYSAYTASVCIHYWPGRLQLSVVYHSCLFKTKYAITKPHAPPAQSYQCNPG